MTERQRLNNRRASTSFNFEAHGMQHTATYSKFPDGRLSCGRCAVKKRTATILISTNVEKAQPEAPMTSASQQIGDT